MILEDVLRSGMADLQNSPGSPFLNGFGQVSQTVDEPVVIGPELSLIGFTFFLVGITIFNDDQSHPAPGPLGIIVDKLRRDDPLGVRRDGKAWGP